MEAAEGQHDPWKNDYALQPESKIGLYFPYSVLIRHTSLEPSASMDCRQQFFVCILSRQTSRLPLGSALPSGRFDAVGRIREIDVHCVGSDGMAFTTWIDAQIISE
jgi:hypothetical protein